MKFWIATLALLMGGCVTTAEQAKLRAAFPVDHAHVKSITERLFAANRDLCSWNLCNVPVHVEYNDGRHAVYGVHTAAAWASFDGWIGLDGYFVGLAQQFKRNTGADTDGEISLLVGHEWAHFLLGHVELLMSGAVSSRAWEDAADCVGAVLSQRAGFDMTSGLPLSKLMGENEGAKIELYSSVRDQNAKISDAGRKAQALIDQKSPIDRAAIERICGLRW